MEIIHLRPTSPWPLSDATRRHRAGRPQTPPYFILHRMGFTVRATLPPPRWALAPPFHPYPAEARRFAFCGTFLGVTPTRRYLASCPVVLGLSSREPEGSPATSCIARTGRGLRAIGEAVEAKDDGAPEWALRPRKKLGRLGALVRFETCPDGPEAGSLAAWPSSPSPP